MKRPPTKKQMISQRNRFLKQFTLILLVIGLMYWVGWKSPWAKRPANVDVYAMDMPQPMVQKPATTGNPASTHDSSSNTMDSQYPSSQKQASETPANIKQ